MLRDAVTANRQWTTAFSTRIKSSQDMDRLGIKADPVWDEVGVSLLPKQSAPQSPGSYARECRVMEPNRFTILEANDVEGSASHAALARSLSLLPACCCSDKGSGGTPHLRAVRIGASIRLHLPCGQSGLDDSPRRAAFVGLGLCMRSSPRTHGVEPCRVGDGTHESWSRPPPFCLPTVFRQVL